DHITFEPNELACDLGVAFVATLSPAILDRDVAGLDPAEFAQPLHKGGSPLAIDCGRSRAQEPDDRQLARLLRSRAATPQPRRRAWLRIFVVRCSLPCDPRFGGHSCNRRRIPRFRARSVTKADRQVE